MTVLGKQKIHDQRGMGGLYKALGELKIPNLSTGLLPVPFAQLVLTTTEARVTVSCLNRARVSFRRILCPFTEETPASECVTRGKHRFLLHFLSLLVHG